MMNLLIRKNGNYFSYGLLIPELKEIVKRF